HPSRTQSFALSRTRDISIRINFVSWFESKSFRRNILKSKPGGRGAATPLNVYPSSKESAWNRDEGGHASKGQLFLSIDPRLGELKTLTKAPARPESDRVKAAQENQDDSTPDVRMFVGQDD